MTRLKVRIIDNETCITRQINPFHPSPGSIKTIVDDYVQEVRARLHVDLMVEYTDDSFHINTQGFKVEDFDEAVKFLRSKDDILKEGE